jgi:hypothetical protein
MKGATLGNENVKSQKKGAEMPKIFYTKFSWMIGPHKSLF